MKTLLLLTLAVSGGHLFAESAIPKAYDRSRYDETITESPFALATPPTEKEAPPEEVNKLTNLFITGLSQQDGKDCVMIRNVSDTQGVMLVGNEPYRSPDPEHPSDYDGISVDKVNWGDRYTVVSVTLRHGDKTRDGVGFKVNVAAAPGGAMNRPPIFPGQQNAPAAPGVQGNPGNGRFNRPPAAAPVNTIIPPGLNPANATRGGGANVQSSRGNFTPGAPRAAGNEAIRGGGVPRPGSNGAGFRGGGGNGNGNGATPNAGPTRTRTRDNPIRNGR